MMIVRNEDRPGIIGLVGTVLGEAGLNIADMDVGRARPADDGTSPGTAVMLIAPSAAVEPPVVEALRAAPGIISVAVLSA